MSDLEICYCQGASARVGHWYGDDCPDFRVTAPGSGQERTDAGAP